MTSYFSVGVFSISENTFPEKPNFTILFIFFFPKIVTDFIPIFFNKIAINIPIVPSQIIAISDNLLIFVCFFNKDRECKTTAIPSIRIHNLGLKLSSNG